MDINTQLRQLFTIERELTKLLKDKQVDKFHQRQLFFTDQVSTLLKSNRPDALASVLEELKKLEKRVGQLCSQADIYLQQLKEQSLLHQRNKSKIKAYK